MNAEEFYNKMLSHFGFNQLNVKEYGNLRAKEERERIFKELDSILCDDYNQYWMTKAQYKRIKEESE